MFLIEHKINKEKGKKNEKNVVKFIDRILCMTRKGLRTKKSNVQMSIYQNQVHL